MKSQIQAVVPVSFPQASRRILMKKVRRVELCFLIIVSVFCSTLVVNRMLASTHAKSRLISQGKIRGTKTKTGREVTERVNQLKQANKHVRNALRAFERNADRTGRLPQLEESWALVSNVSSNAVSRALTPTGFAPNRRVAFNPQEVSEDGIEIIFVPTYSAFGEWQGTVICNRYDGAGNFLEQYVADVVLKQEPVAYTWFGVYEVSFEANDAWLQSDPALGMIADLNFELGTPVEQQRFGDNNQGPITTIFGGAFLNSTYTFGTNTLEPQGSWYRPRVPASGPNPKVRNWVGCTVAWCAGTGGVGCGALSLLTAGVAFGPCATSACLGSAAACGLSQIF
jgi:hypothetical protein